MKPRRNKITINIGFAILAVLLMMLGLLSFLISCSSPQASKEGQTLENGIEVEIEIKEGMSLNEIADLLANKGIVDNSFFFKLYVQQEGKEKNLLPGKYKLLTGSEYSVVLSSITSEIPEVSYKIVIPEGFIISQTLDRIAQDLPFIKRADLDKAVDKSNYNYEFLKDAASLEGFLFPKTYEVTINYTAQNIIEMLLTQYQLETGKLDYSSAAKDNLTPYDILKIASLIEREAYVPEERPLISAVIHNRLKEGMLLQIDATVRYALNKWDEIVTFEDLKVDSPYNTYLYAGLMPTPISSPGLASIEAALAPADVDYLYYVVTDPEKHTHSFSRTLEGHEQNKSNQ
ncbi:MAG: endolytic transglycosylase MltG [Actinobacteria bacterium]|nr:endolytic transglycosylase MltG [Actinomycetota bacterium]MCL5072078.1 endolytic transglycosylase MltG [Actinomycetota bacterium]